MNKYFLLSLFSLLSFSHAFSQTHNFELNWKKGEEKYITYTEKISKWENDSLISQEENFKDAHFKVLSVDKENIKFRLSMENIALKNAIDFYEKAGEDIELEDLKLVYEVNKSTGELSLKNWKEARDFMLGSFDQITEVIEQKEPEGADMLDLLLSPILQMFESKEMIESSMNSQVEFLIIPILTEYNLGETKSITESTENPFSPGQMVEATVKYTLNSVDKNMCSITEEKVLDMSMFIEMLKTMMTEMFKAFAEEGAELPQDKLDELDQIKMDATIINNIEFDKKSGWVNKSVTTSTMDGNDPKDGTMKNEVIMTIVVK